MRDQKHAMSQFRDHGSLHPTEGARFLFERRSITEDQRDAVYHAAVFTPGERFDYRVEMTLDGAFELMCDSRSADAALEAKLANIAKLIARAAGRKLSNELPPWPHRVLRWRGPGR